MDRIDWTIEIAKFFLGLIFMLSLAGCSQTGGWQVAFGVAPLSSVDNRQSFDSEKQAKVRRVNY